MAGNDTTFFINDNLSKGVIIKFEDVAGTEKDGSGYGQRLFGHTYDYQKATILSYKNLSQRVTVKQDIQLIEKFTGFLSRLVVSDEVNKKAIDSVVVRYINAATDKLISYGITDFYGFSEAKVWYPVLFGYNGELMQSVDSIKVHLTRKGYHDLIYKIPDHLIFKYQITMRGWPDPVYKEMVPKSQ